MSVYAALPSPEREAQTRLDQVFAQAFSSDLELAYWHVDRLCLHLCLQEHAAKPMEANFGAVQAAAPDFELFCEGSRSASPLSVVAETVASLSWHWAKPNPLLFPASTVAPSGFIRLTVLEPSSGSPEVCYDPSRLRWTIIEA